MKIISLTINLEIDDEFYEKLKEIARNNMIAFNKAYLKMVEKHQDEFDQPMTYEDAIDYDIDEFDDYEKEYGHLCGYGDSLEKMFKDELKLKFESNIYGNPYFDDSYFEDKVYSIKNKIIDMFEENKEDVLDYLRDNLFWGKVYKEVKEEKK